MEKQFRVIIVGGSIAGLTLAHCLHKLGVDYVVLEKRAEIAPREGAAIGIMPNGARVLDQLGVYDEIEAAVEPMHSACMLHPDGFRSESKFPKYLHQR